MIIFQFLIGQIFAGQLKVTINPDASWSLSGPKGFQLESGTYMLHRHGTFFHTDDQSLTVEMVTDNRTGSDNLGEYVEHVFQFKTAGRDQSVVPRTKENFCPMEFNHGHGRVKFPSAEKLSTVYNTIVTIAYCTYTNIMYKIRSGSGNSRIYSKLRKPRSINNGPTFLSTLDWNGR